MTEHEYDIIVIGCGSGGLSIGLFMNKAGFKVLMISKTDKSIGGDCLNDGCVPSKSLLHVSKVIGSAKKASSFGLTISGDVDIKKAVEYIYGKQEVIREHENASWLKEKGVEVALGNAQFTGKNEIQVNGKRYFGKKIVIATGSRPKKLHIPGIEQVKYYDNKNIFTIENLPEKLLAKTPFGSLSFTLSGSNLWYYAPNFPKYMHFDPETNGLGVSNGKGLEFITGPSARRLGVSVRVTF